MRVLLDEILRYKKGIDCFIILKYNVYRFSIMSIIYRYITAGSLFAVALEIIEQEQDYKI